MKSFFKENLFEEKEFNDLKSFILSQIDSFEDFRYAKAYGRYYQGVHFEEPMRSLIVQKARENFGIDNLDIVYTQCAKYQIKDGCIPSLGRHKDNFYATHTMDIVIETTIDWPLEVEGEYFPSTPNVGMFLKGDEDYHSRPEYPSDDNKDYLIVIFVNLAPEGHEALIKAREFFALPEHVRKQMRDKMVPNDVNKYNLRELK